jgi:hypothetical protein
VKVVCDFFADNLWPALLVERVAQQRQEHFLRDGIQILQRGLCEVAKHNLRAIDRLSEAQARAQHKRKRKQRNEH